MTATAGPVSISRDRYGMVLTSKTGLQNGDLYSEWRIKDRQTKTLSLLSIAVPQISSEIGWMY